MRRRCRRSPTPSARCSPTTSRASRSRYYGRDRAASTDNAPTWRDSWEDPQLLPILIQIEVTPRRAIRGPRSSSRRATSPEAGCRAWDPSASMCVGMRRCARSHHARPAPSQRQRGIAVIIVLWLTIMLTVIASGFAFSMRSEALPARNALSLAQARAAADGAIERMAFELSRPRMADAWARDGSAHAWRDGDVVDHRPRRSTSRRASTSTPRPTRC